VFSVRYGLYLCVPYGSHNKQRLFTHLLVGLCSGEVCVFCEVRTVSVCSVWYSQSTATVFLNTINQLGSVAEM
jgi:hypothetical protein